MKKTLIAAGIAAVVAAPAAFAEVKISGKVEQGFTWTDSSTAADDEMLGNSDVVLKFSASEDLGNGMTAFASIRRDLDGANGAADDSLTDFKVGLKGSFGTVMTGRIEDFTESKALALVDVFQNAAAGVETGDAAGRQDDAIAYLSPNMNGFSVGVGAYAHDDNSSSEDIRDIDATDIALMYSNGPLFLIAAQERVKDPSTSANEDQKVTTFGAKYTFGDLTVSGYRSSIDNDGHTAANDHDDTALAAVYKMGNNSVAVGWSKDELTTGATDDTKWSVEMRHSFSKRTSVAVSYRDHDDAAGADTEELGVGLEHKF